MPIEKCKLNSNREIVFNNEEEKNLFISQCQKLVPEGSKKIKKEKFEFIVYDLLVDILRTFERRDENTYGETMLTYMKPSWFLKWQMSIKIDFDFKKKILVAKSDIDDAFEKSYLFVPYFNIFVKIE